jgi:hypothetical protein
MGHKTISRFIVRSKIYGRVYVAAINKIITLRKMPDNIMCSTLHRVTVEKTYLKWYMTFIKQYFKHNFKENIIPNVKIIGYLSLTFNRSRG